MKIKTHRQLMNNLKFAGLKLDFFQYDIFRRIFGEEKKSSSYDYNIVDEWGIKQVLYLVKNKASDSNCRLSYRVDNYLIGIFIINKEEENENYSCYYTPLEKIQILDYAAQIDPIVDKHFKNLGIKELRYLSPNEMLIEDLIKLHPREQLLKNWEEVNKILDFKWTEKEMNYIMEDFYKYRNINRFISIVENFNLYLFLRGENTKHNILKDLLKK